VHRVLGHARGVVAVGIPAGDPVDALPHQLPKPFELDGHRTSGVGRLPQENEAIDSLNPRRPDPRVGSHTRKNMSIRVLLMGVIGRVTGEREVVLPVEAGLTLRRVLDDLDRRFGPEFGCRVFRSQTAPRPLQLHTRIFVNGTLVEEDALDRPLPASGEAPEPSEVLIYLLPAATGG
jgi:hypothetical protein